MKIAILAVIFGLAAQSALPQLPPPPPPPPPLPVLVDGLLLGNNATPPEPIVQNGDGVVEGIVTRPDNGEPVRDVQILLSVSTTGTPAVQQQLSMLTDGTGTFAFNKLPAGRYTVRAQRENYFGPSLNGNTQTIVTTPAILDTAHTTIHVAFNLTPGGTISGNVRNADGQPATNLTVAAMRLTYRDGRRLLTPAKQVQTDDRGDFRLWGLPPGEFYVRTGAPIGSRGGSGGTYFPGVVDPESAEILKVRSGGEVNSNLRVQPVPTIHISGTLVNTIPELTSTPIGFLLMPHDLSGIDEGISGNLISNEAPDRTSSNFQITTSRTGVFDLMPVVPVRRDPGTPPTAELRAGNPQYYTGRTTVEIRSQDIQGVTIVVTRGADLEIHFKGQVSAAELQTTRIGLRPIDAVSTPLTSHLNLLNKPPTDGTLTLASVPEGHYVVVPQTLPSGAYVQDIRQGERSIYESGTIAVGRGTAESVEIVLGSGGGRIEGAIAGADTKTAGAVRLSLVPQGTRGGNPVFYKRAVAVNGRFVISDIVPGEYKLYAWEDWPASADENAKFLAQFGMEARAISVTPGSSASDLTIPLLSGSASQLPAPVQKQSP